MIKLEEKLIELGYETNCKDYKIWLKGNIKIIIFYGKIEYYGVITPNNIHTQQEIDSLQQEFNQLQKDLKVLENVD